VTIIRERPLREHLRVEILDPETPFVLGASFLNAAPLGDVGAVPIWSDWAAGANGIKIRRGGAVDGLGVAMQPGISSISLYGFSEPDPIAPIFVANRQLRVVQQLAAGEHVLFTGRVRDIELVFVQPSPGRRHVPITTITVVDAVADHDQVKRYGALPSAGSETFGQRIRRLSASAVAPIEQPAVTTYQDESGNEIRLGRTVLESALSEHFTLACSTVGALWWVGGDGVTRFTPRRGATETAPAAVFWFDGYDGGKPAGALHPLGGDLAAGARVTFTVGIARNIGAIDNPDDPGSWLGTETETIYREPLPESGGSTRLGRSPVTTTINTANGFHRLWSLQFPYDSGSEQLVTLRWNAQEDLARIPDLEIGNVIEIWHPVRGLQHAQIAGVQHEITPTRWLIELALIPGALYDV
jgi:hypothetical protein